jgi:hypothetical protein
VPLRHPDVPCLPARLPACLLLPSLVVSESLRCFLLRLPACLQAGNKIRADLEAPFAALREAARRVGRVAAECKMEMDVDEYVESFRPGGWCMALLDIARQLHGTERSLLGTTRHRSGTAR